MNLPKVPPVRAILIFATLNLCMLCAFESKAQTFFNANYADFNFLAANKIHKVGTDGSAVGNVTLYTNIITISGQQIDCIVRTISLTGGTFQIPGGAPGGTIPFDYSSATGSGMSANEDRFFSPCFNWTATGSCRFRFEFILGGSYNNGTNTGTPVTLQNVYVNTYDIDGNGSANSNQNNEFGGFNTAQYKTGTGSNLTPSYNSTTGLTRFRSGTTTNTAAITDDANRVKVSYAYLSTIDIVVGADGGGVAYYFLDFGQGPAWTVTPAVITTPVLDLNTSTTGVDNSTLGCTNMVNFTSGTTNLTGSSNAVDEIEILFPASDILDGNSEVVIPKVPSSATDSVKLGSSFAGSQNTIINSVTYHIIRSTGGGTDTIMVRPLSGTFTTAQTETFLDSLRYVDIKPVPTTGDRNFTVTEREGFIKTPPAVFVAVDNCTLLPVKFISFSADKKNDQTVNLNWSTVQELGSKDFLIQHSTNGTIWNSLATVAAKGNTNQITNYSYTHFNPVSGNNYYRLQLRDISGNSTASNVNKVYIGASNTGIKIMNNPVVNGKLRVQLVNTGIVNIFSSDGQVRLSRQLNSGLNDIDVSNFSKGVYNLQSGAEGVRFVVQ